MQITVIERKRKVHNLKIMFFSETMKNSVLTFSIFLKILNIVSKFVIENGEENI